KESGNGRATCPAMPWCRAPSPSGEPGALTPPVWWRGGVALGSLARRTRGGVGSGRPSWPALLCFDCRAPESCTRKAADRLQRRRGGQGGVRDRPLSGPTFPGVAAADRDGSLGRMGRRPMTPRPGDFAVVDTLTRTSRLIQLGEALSRGGFTMFDHAVICSRVRRDG